MKEILDLLLNILNQIVDLPFFLHIIMCYLVTYLFMTVYLFKGSRR